MTSIPNYTKKHSKNIRELDKPAHVPTAYNPIYHTYYAYTVRTLIKRKFSQTILHMLTDLKSMKILLKTILELNKSLTCVFLGCSIRAHTLKYKIMYIHAFIVFK